MIKMKKLILLALGCCTALMLDAQTVIYQYAHPDGKKIHHGFWTVDTGAMDWQQTKGLRLECFSDGKQSEQLEVSFASSNKVTGKAIIALSGKGWQRVMIPWNRFDTNSAELVAALRCVKSVCVKSLIGGKSMKVRQVEALKGDKVALEAVVKGRSADAGNKVVYTFTATNVTDQPLSIAFSVPTKGWEMMTSEIEPAVLTLNSGEQRECKLTVSIREGLPVGNREHQKVQAIINGVANETDQIEFVTAVRLPAPNILLTQNRWDEVREKVKHYDWAMKAQKDYINKADKWTVPQIATRLSGDNDQLGPHIFRTPEEHGLMAAAISYQLTGERCYAEKVLNFMRRLCDSERGYLKTLRGCSQSFVQEGHFFQHIAMAYDAVLPSGVFTDTDKQQIEAVFRKFIDVVRLQEEQGGINNWKLSEMCGALYCALALQDWSLAEELLYHPSMIVDHLSHGVMNDGFWYECSVGYNVWCATEFSQVALAIEPWGEDLIHRKVPMGATPWYSLMPDFKKGAAIYGVNFHKWGPVTKNSVCIKDMWDAIPRFADYRGVMFAVNDAQETLVAGESYELAYYLYRDPEYAAIIRRGNSRDLLYGVPELPEVESLMDKHSAYADNIGIINLRSQKKDRPQREQIQAYLHYGTHGGFHGHFDRASFLGMMRYGRSFFNPEMIWYGYPSYMYKFYVQASMDKNMVVVDDKMQLPRESYRRLFQSGEKVQAAMVETVSPWANPPYGGMEYDWANGMTFQQKMWSEGRSIREAEDHPAYGAITDETEPITQRRLMVVTDDYIVLADYLKGEHEHCYDNLFQMKGFEGLDAKQKTMLRHDGQMVADCRSAAQFITDCQWWQTEGTVLARFSTGFGKGYDNEGNRCPFSEDGPLHINVLSAWPRQAEVMVGTQPEPIDVQQQVSWQVLGDGQVLAEGKCGIWILGEQQIDVPLHGVHQLSLRLKTAGAKRNTLFWGNGILTLAGGDHVKLTDLSMTTDNIQTVPSAGKDYYGGPIKIAGMPMADALPAQPKEEMSESEIDIDVSSIKAERLQVVLGGDFPLGDEAPRRKTLAIRSRGKEARFLTVVEPYEQTAMVERVEAADANHLTVWLKDGRLQEIIIAGMDGDGSKANVKLVESPQN
jgi:hypothetical protein